MKQLYDLIIVGAGPSGLSAAIYAGRSKLKTLVLEDKEVGGQIRITSDVVNYPGILKTDGATLSNTMKKQAEQFGVSFKNARISSLSLDKDIKEIVTDDEQTYSAVSVILATGAKPRTLGFKGEAEFTGHGVAYCATCDGEFFSGLPVFVIGAGFAAAEEALFLTRFADKVTVIAREPQFTCSKTIADKVLAHPKIEVKFNTEVVSISGDKLPNKAVFVNNVTGENTEYNVPSNYMGFGVFVFVGYYPLTELYKGIIDLDPQGYVITNEDMQTSLEGVYAAGDLRVKRLRQLVTAVSDGAIAATSIEKYVEHKKDQLGITIEVEQSTEPVEANSEDFFDEDLKDQLKPILANMKSNIKLNVVYNSENDFAKELMNFAKDFAQLGDKLSYEFIKEASDTKLYPYIEILKDDSVFSGIKYYAVPGGHEFNSFVLAVYNASGAGQPIESNIKDTINKVSSKKEINICISLSCTLCPDLVAAAQTIALNNDLVNVNIIDLVHFPDLKNKHSIMSVPAIILENDKVVFGKKNIDELINIIIEN